MRASEVCRHCGEKTDRSGFCVCNGAKHERELIPASKPAVPAQPVDTNCNKRVCGEYNMLRCVAEKGHKGDHIIVVDKEK